MAAKTYRGWKWMSAMTGICDFLAITGSASASSVSGTATRTIWQPEAVSSAICCRVALMSAVLVVVIDCTLTGKSLPTPTPPTCSCRVFRRGASTGGGAVGMPRLTGVAMTVSIPRALDGAGDADVTCAPAHRLVRVTSDTDVAGHPLPSRLVTLDPVGANVASFAGAAVLVGAILFVVGGSRLGHLLGFRPDAPLLFNPVGARVLGLLIGYPGLLVAVWALAYGLIAPHTETTALPVQGGLAASAGVLVLTGARFARFLTFQVGGRTAVEGELSKDEIVPVDEIGDDVDLAAAVQAARRGEWRPAAALLAATGDADVRADRIRVLTQQSILDSQWIEEWFAAAPDDALVTTVRAELAVQRAWAARGAMDAAHTPDEAIQAFVTGLNQAERLAERAIELAPPTRCPGRRWSRSPAVSRCRRRSSSVVSTGCWSGLRTTCTDRRSRCSTSAPSGSATATRCSASPGSSAGTPPRARRRASCR
jgi:hypothetical protein